MVDNEATVPDAIEPAFGYTAAAMDPGTGDWHLRTRDYDPSMGAFTMPDSAAPHVRSPQLTTYHYTSNQPLLYVDPSGRVYCPDWLCDSLQTVGDAVDVVAHTASNVAGGAVNGAATGLDFTAACITPYQWLEGICSDYLNGGGWRPGEWVSGHFTDLIGADPDAFCYNVGEWVGPPVAGGAKAAVRGIRKLLEHLASRGGKNGAANAGSKLLLKIDHAFQFPGAGRSGAGVKNFVGPPNAIARGASPGRVFVTDEQGRVILDITRDRVKPVVPGQGFVAGDGRKLTPTSEQLGWIDELWGR